jgi:hypothetical protein
LSDIGSKILPKVDTWLSFLARNPSKKSVRLKKIKKIKIIFFSICNSNSKKRMQQKNMGDIILNRVKIFAIFI